MVYTLSCEAWIGLLCWGWRRSVVGVWGRTASGGQGVGTPFGVASYSCEVLVVFGDAPLPVGCGGGKDKGACDDQEDDACASGIGQGEDVQRSEEHTSELQSR